MASPTYLEIIDALHVRFLTVLPHATRAIIGEPKSVQSAPMVFSRAADDGGEAQDGKTFGLYRMVYRTQHTLVVNWVDWENAERELMDLIPKLIDAVRRDPRLGIIEGSDPEQYLLPGGQCRITRWETGWAKIAEKTYRVADLFSEVEVYPYALPEA